MKNKLAFVLGGGGARGALQVGALYALLERGYQPDLLVGVSIGAVNATYLALHGFSRDTLDRLSATWLAASAANLLPANYLWLTLRSMVRRSPNDPSHRLKDFFIAQGFDQQLRFSDVTGCHLLIVSADLNTGRPVCHGQNLDDNLLEALLLSTALPPWFMPVKKGGQYLMDGGIVSNLPIETAMHAGAKEIVAFDLLFAQDLTDLQDGFGTFLERIMFTVEKRHTDLELELARARGIPTVYLRLLGKRDVPLWDFSHSEELIAEGYEIASQVLDSLPPKVPAPLAKRLQNFLIDLPRRRRAHKVSDEDTNIEH